MATMTISGLASGLDTDRIIEQLMQIERTPVTRLEQRKADLQVKASAWGDLRTRLVNLLGTLTGLKLQGTFTGRTVTSSDEAAVAGTATSSAAEGIYRIQVNRLAQAHKVATEDRIKGKISVPGTFGIQVGDTTKWVTVTAEDTLATLVEKINNTTSGAGEIVTATAVDSRLVLTSKTTGAGGEMKFYDPDGVLQAIGLVDGALAPRLTLLEAQDAELVLEDKLTVTASSNTVKDLIQGVTLTLSRVTEGAVTIKVARNTEAAVKAVQSFVEQYNSVMDFIAQKLGKTASGSPGDLFGDPTLSRIQQELRSRVFSPVATGSTSYTTAASVGLSTGEASTALTFDRSGKLTLNEGKLREALEEDPDAVYRLFGQNKGEKGIAVRLYEYVTSLTRASLGTTASTGDGVISAKQKWLEASIKNIDEQIARWEDRLALKEEQLRRQFTAMESALGNLQSQANWLANQILALQGASGSNRR